MRGEREARLHVLTHALIDEHTLEQLADPTYWKFWTGVNPLEHLEEFKVRTLVVDLQDTASARIVWRGLATGTIDPKVKKIAERVDKIVAKLFKKFPPGS